MLKALNVLTSAVTQLSLAGFVVLASAPPGGNVAAFGDPLPADAARRQLEVLQ